MTYTAVKCTVHKFFMMDRVTCQNKFVKSVHLVGFIIKKFGQHVFECTQETFPSGVTGIHADVRILAATETHIQFVNRSAEMRCTLVPVAGQVTSST